MSTIYIPQRIDTVGQAKALPSKTPVLTYDSHTGNLLYSRLAEDELPEYLAPRTNHHSVALVPTTAVHELAEEWSNNSDRGWYSSFGEELAEVLAGRPHG